MSVKKLRLGVIGAGSWVHASHLPTLAARGDVDFIAVCRRGAAELEHMRSHWGFELASEDYTDILGRDLDAVIVASPSALHYEHAKTALESGAHVLVEKPFTVHSKEAWDLVETATEHNRHLVVSYGYNYKPVVQSAAKLLADHGGVGDIESMLVSMSSGTRTLLTKTGVYVKAGDDVPPDQETWTDPRLSGGGYGQAQLTHALGIALWLTDLRAKEVFAYMPATGIPGVELSDAIAVRYQSGAVGTVTGSSAHPGFLDERDQLHVRVVGTKAQLNIDFDRDMVSLYSPDLGSVGGELSPGDGEYDCKGPPNALADLALGHDVPNLSPGELGARTVELLEAAYRSAESGRPESVETAGAS
jgi:predicted dehydrogenase